MMTDETTLSKAALLDLLLTLPDTGEATPFNFFASLADQSDKTPLPDAVPDDPTDPTDPTDPDDDAPSDNSNSSNNSNNSNNSNPTDPSNSSNPSDPTNPLPDSFRAAIADNLGRLAGFRAGRRVADPDWEEAFRLLLSAAGAMARGTVSEDLLDALLKAVTYDRAVAVADREGEVRGRNAVIVERLRHADPSDGVPALQSSRGGSTVRRSRSIFDLASEAR